MLLLGEFIRWSIVTALTIVVFLGLHVLWRRHRAVLREVRLPTAFLMLGTLALLLTAQGRDLGVALLDAPWSQHAFFALALLFWGTATWHAARVALDGAFGAVPAKWGEAAGWVRWTPRILGGGVFVLALVSVWLADPQLDRWQDLARLWVLVIAAGAFYALLVVKRRAIGEWCKQWLAERRVETALRLDRAFARDEDVSGIAALAFSTKLFIGAFCAVALGVAVFAWIDPWTLGDWLGAMAIGFFAFGAYLTLLAAARFLPAGWRGPLVLLLVLVTIATELSRISHPVRLAKAEDVAWQDRPNVADAAIAWYESARAAAPHADELPMVIVASAGGGLRAAYWTAVVLAELRHELDQFGAGAFERHLFAVSGVSGGSVGAAYFAALAKAPETAGELGTALKQALSGDFLAPTLASLAFVDLPSMVLPQFGQTRRGQALELAFERASNVEGNELLAGPFLDLGEPASGETWAPLLLFNATHQETGRRLIASHVLIDERTFVDAFDLQALLEADVRVSTAAHNSARFTYVSPSGTLVSADGEKLGHVIDGGYFENFGALTAAQLGRAALNAIADHLAKLDDGAPAVRPIFVQISSDPALLARDRAGIGEDGPCDASATDAMAFEPTTGRLWWSKPGDDGGRTAPANQLLAPIRGVFSTRVAHGLLASKQLAQATCSDHDIFVHFAMPEEPATPLGWVLSGGSRRIIEGYLEDRPNQVARDRVLGAFAGLQTRTD